MINKSLMYNRYNLPSGRNSASAPSILRNIGILRCLRTLDAPTDLEILDLNLTTDCLSDPAGGALHHRDARVQERVGVCLVVGFRSATLDGPRLLVGTKVGSPRRLGENRDSQSWHRI